MIRCPGSRLPPRRTLNPAYLLLTVAVATVDPQQAARKPADSLQRIRSTLERTSIPDASGTVGMTT
jgi:hypothetical protein